MLAMLMMALPGKVINKRGKTDGGSGPGGPGDGDQ
jgi:hypothetical protein